MSWSPEAIKHYGLVIAYGEDRDVAKLKAALKARNRLSTGLSKALRSYTDWGSYHYASSKDEKERLKQIEWSLWANEVDNDLPAAAASSLGGARVRHKRRRASRPRSRTRSRSRSRSSRRRSQTRRRR